MYAGVARSEGLSISDEEMEGLMREVHDRLPLEISGSWRYELPWFSALIEELFVENLGLERRKLDSVQAALFSRYRDPGLFKVLPGAFELLGGLARCGVSMAVISNWSPDLHTLLNGLGLAESLEFALTSAEERCEKPNEEIFRRALERTGISPENALHIGNDPRNDYDGAVAVGMDALLIGPDDGGGRRCVADLFAASKTLS